MNRTIIFIILSFLFTISIYSQTSLLQGKVLDSLQTPIVFANLIADPINGENVKFTMTDEQGHFEIRLLKKTNYRITISSLGYIPKTFVYKHTQKKYIIVLKESSESLDKVTIKYTPPIVVKTDTTIYKVESFTNGKERKLKQVLQKLPGVEVDRVGNVKVNGKKVTKLLVENEEFFTGDTKLAVNNIPADVVDKIEVLDNFQKTSLLKDLEDSNKLVMNIRLHKDKNKFIFGDIEVGGGIQDRFLIHPAYYYYSPKTRMYFIGDYNNIGEKSFSSKDYLNLEGGKSLMMNSSAYFAIKKNDFSKFLTNTDFNSSTNRFGALSFLQKIKKTKINAYVIADKISNTNRIDSRKELLYDTPIVHIKDDQSANDNQFIIGKIQISRKEAFKSDFTSNTYAKLSHVNYMHNITGSDVLQKKTIYDEINFSQDIDYHLKLQGKNTISFTGLFSYKKATPLTNWQSEKKLFIVLLPLKTDDTYQITQQKKTSSLEINLATKYYWVLNRFNHLYVTLGWIKKNDSYYNNVFQTLSDKSIYSFANDDFGNNFSFNNNDLFGGLQYKFMWGKAVLKTGIFYHQYAWEQSEYGVNNHKNLWQPEFSAKIKLTSAKRIRFNYAYSPRFHRTELFSSKRIIISDNGILQGNPNMSLEAFHNFSLSFFNTKLIKGRHLFISLKYAYSPMVYQYNTTYYGRDILQLPEGVNADVHSGVASINMGRKFRKIRLGLNTSAQILHYKKIVNNNLQTLQQQNYNASLSVKTKFNKFPNFGIIYSKSLARNVLPYKGDVLIDKYDFIMEYVLMKNIALNANVRIESYNNLLMDDTSNYSLSNLELLYNKTNSPWTFTINVSNLFDVAYKRNDKMDAFVISNKRIFIMPRIAMFNISYKF